MNCIGNKIDYYSDKIKGNLDLLRISGIRLDDSFLPE